MMHDDNIDELDLLAELEDDDGPAPRNVLLVQIFGRQGVVVRNEDEVEAVVAMFYVQAEQAKRRNDRVAWGRAMSIAWGLPVQFRALKTGRLVPNPTLSTH